MKPVKFTHTGVLVGVDSRTAPDYKLPVKLRRTERLWVTHYDTRYRRKDGRLLGTVWGKLKLDLASVKEIASAD